jgi:hypothetical protein
MEELTFLDNQLNYRGQFYQVGDSMIMDDVVVTNLFDAENNFNVILVSNQTSINGVIQTSSQMIIDTLTNA